MDDRRRRRLLNELYATLAPLSTVPAQGRPLGELTSNDVAPKHGVYLFTEPGELREDGQQPRIVRVGTHALSERSSTTMWSRLRTHRGSMRGKNAGGGSHRSSIFRLHVGTALLARGQHPEAAATWGVGSSAPADVRAVERPLERAVSDHLRTMPVYWLAVPDRIERGLLERGCIALLSNSDRPSIDPPSPSWLGALADRPAVRESGLWNVNHVDEQPDLDTLDLVAAAVARTLAPAEGAG